MQKFPLLVAMSVMSLSGLTVSEGRAATPSCQQLLAPPDDETDTSEPNPDSEFGPGLFDIDGASIGTTDELRAAITNAKGKVPIIKGGDFAGWNFAALDFRLSNVCFFQGKMAGSKWDGGTFPGIGFVEADLAGSRFHNAQLGGVLIRNSFLTGVDMRGAKLDGGLLDGGWRGSLSNWDLSGASLRGFRFVCGLTLSDGCPLDRSGVIFAGADFSDADISTYPFWGQADYSGATLSNTRLSPRHLTDIDGAIASGAVILVGGDHSVPLSPSEFEQLRIQAKAEKKRSDAPSFPCERAGSKVEKMICATDDYGLRAWDRIMADIYSDVRKRNPAIAADQRKWLASRGRCKEALCLSELYGARVKVLLLKLGEPDLLARGETALFIDEPVAFPEGFRSTELFQRIVPVLVEASLGEAVVERAVDGSYLISGESIAANAHTCSVSGSGLHFNQSTGWFSAHDASGKSKPVAVFRAFRDEIEFPASGHPTDEEFPGSSDFASCGMRASLMPMKRIQLPADLLAKRKAALSAGY